jgi:uncharacterized membrane protein
MSTLYAAALFIHVVTAILLVGGSSWSHVAGGMLHRSDTVEGARSHVRFLATFTKASGPLAVLVLLAGAYMATDAGMWNQGWLLTSLVLFILVGAGAGMIVDPTVRRFVEVLDAAPDGPLTPALRGDLFDRRLTVTLSLFAAADLAIVFLMTTKPALATSLTATGVSMALAGLWALRELRAHQPDTGAAPAI